MHRSHLMLTSLLLAACGGAEAPAVSLALTGISADRSPEAQDAAGTRLSFAVAEAYVRHIEFQLPDGRRCSQIPEAERASLVCDDDDDDKLRLPGPFVFDLMTGESEPSLVGVRIPAGTYERVDVRFDDAEPSEGLVLAGHPLAQSTLRAEGAFESAGGPIPFDLELKFNEDARFERPGGIRVEADGAAQVALWLDVSTWFSSLPLTGCLADGDLELRDGGLSIRDGAGDCGDVEGTLKETIKRSGQMDRDD